uniref:Wu:fc23c09 n=1 Tax=Pundamilia nyererei TaxID=303518 RepID=A0A3B4EWW3_9CICH
MENYTKLTGKQNKASSPQLQLNKSSAKPQLGTAKTPSPRPVKNNKQSKNKTIKKSKEKRRKKNNKTQKPPKKKKEILPPTQFPYFKDNYCPIEVPADLPASLEELRLDNNRLTVISKAAWAWCPGLLVLSLSNNSLGNNSVPNGVLSPLGNLHTLNLDHNMLISVPLGLPLSIKELYLKGNVLESFGRGAFNGKSGLVVLDLSANRLINKGLDRDSFLNTTFLESINLEGNRLKQVPQHLPLSVKTLNLEGNFISSIKKSAFRSLKKLEHLGLAWNKIFKVTTGAFRMLPVLHQLDLSHNTLKQVPRQLPKGLHSVALKHNKIRSVPRDAFCTNAVTENTKYAIYLIFFFHSNEDRKEQTEKDIKPHPRCDPARQNTQADWTELWYYSAVQSFPFPYL